VSDRDHDDDNSMALVASIRARHQQLKHRRDGADNPAPNRRRLQIGSMKSTRHDLF